jgi:hypothetical protein
MSEEQSVTVTLADGRVFVLQPPTAGALRGIKLLEVLQLEVGAHAALLPRLGGPSALEFYLLGPADLMALMTAVVNFFTPSMMAGEIPSLPVSRMPTP